MTGRYARNSTHSPNGHLTTNTSPPTTSPPATSPPTTSPPTPHHRPPHHRHSTTNHPSAGMLRDRGEPGRCASQRLSRSAADLQAARPPRLDRRRFRAPSRPGPRPGLRSPVRGGRPALAALSAHVRRQPCGRRDVASQPALPSQTGRRAPRHDTPTTARSRPLPARSSSPRCDHPLDPSRSGLRVTCQRTSTPHTIPPRTLATRPSPSPRLTERDGSVPWLSVRRGTLGWRGTGGAKQCGRSGWGGRSGGCGPRTR